MAEAVVPAVPLVELTGARRALAWHPLRAAGAFGLLVVTVLLVAVTGLLAACGDTGTGDDVTQPGDVVSYCALSREVNTSGTTPTAVQVTELIRLAPLEIREDVTTFLRSGDASDTGVQAFTRILDFESTHC